MNKGCPCGSLIPYENCCKNYHSGKAKVNSALELLRSRYSAYALNHSDYIIHTTHPDNPAFDKDKQRWKRSIGDFSRTSDFQQLEVLEVNEQDEEAFITFIAYIYQNGKDCSFKEKSYFRKEKGDWLYVSGEVQRQRDLSK